MNRSVFGGKSHAGRLGGQFLIEVTNDVAADAAGLPFVWLEVTYRANWEGRAEQARGRPKKSLPAVPGRMEA